MPRNCALKSLIEEQRGLLVLFYFLSRRLKSHWKSCCKCSRNMLLVLLPPSKYGSIIPHVSEKTAPHPIYSYHSVDSAIFSQHSVYSAIFSNHLVHVRNVNVCGFYNKKQMLRYSYPTILHRGPGAYFRICKISAFSSLENKVAYRPRRLYFLC